MQDGLDVGISGHYLFRLPGNGWNVDCHGRSGHGSADRQQFTPLQPDLWGQGTQIYLRRPFALQAASPAQADAMGQEINRAASSGVVSGLSGATQGLPQ